MSVSRLVVVVHGLHSGRKRSRWVPHLCHLIQDALPRAVAVPFYYGWTSASMVGLPGVGVFVRRRLVRRLQRFVVRKVREHGPTSDLDGVGHSFGCWLLHRSMTQEHGPRAFYDRLVYMGAGVSSREDFRDERGHFGRLLNLYSRGDDVIRLSPIGNAGWRGFLNEDGYRVANLDLTPQNHDQYAEPGQAWDEVIRFLGGPSGR